MHELIKKKFYFLRHGKTDWNNKNLCQGQTDIPLNDEGRKEIELICSLLSKLSFSKIITSPLLRAFQTAEIVQKYFSFPIQTIDEIQERGWGKLEGGASIEMYRVEEEEESFLYPDPKLEIEPRNAFKNRIVSGINTVLKDNETALIVSHGRVFLVLCEILKIPLIRQIPNGIIIECNPLNDGWNILFHTN